MPVVEPGSLVAINAPAIRDAAVTLPDVDCDNPYFLHALLCQLGLPRQKLEERRFERRSGSAALLLQAGEAYNGQRYIPQPLPSGTRPRLVLVHVCSEAVRTKQRTIDIGHSTRDFLRKLNIDVGGRNMEAFRAQMLALSVCQMTLGFLGADKRVRQVNCPPVDKFEAWLVDEAGGRSLWPAEIELSERFFETLREHAVPLNPEGVAKLQHSALSLDAYTWLAHRLCRVRDNAGVFVSWQNLHEQFGQEYTGKDALKDFRKRFGKALRDAAGAYPDAKFDVIAGGLKLFPSAPPVKKVQAVVKLPKPEKPSEHMPEFKLCDGRTEWASSWDRAQELHISHDAIEAMRKKVHGWDMNVLVNKYYVSLATRKASAGRNPTLAFEGWVRKFTKGKPPA